ncbi:MAG TPA: hypothetical protein VFU07_01450 [Candidatus Lumbricidophila sp.]|nr:hypothetical protein [Candidatus Lumbricidophila sp.]
MTNAPREDSRLERILAYMAVGTIVLAIVCIAAVLIGTATGVGANNGFSGGIWPTVFVMPMIALPLGLILFITLFIVNWVRRSKAGTPKN